MGYTTASFLANMNEWPREAATSDSLSAAIREKNTLPYSKTVYLYFHDFNGSAFNRTTLSY